MDNLNAPPLGTILLTDVDTGIIINADSGIGKFSLQCTSATPIGITGTRRATLKNDANPITGKQYPSVEVPLVEGEVVTWQNGAGIQSIKITIPSGATAKLLLL